MPAEAKQDLQILLGKHDKVSAAAGSLPLCCFCLSLFNQAINSKQGDFSETEANCRNVQLKQQRKLSFLANQIIGPFGFHLRIGSSL